MQSSDAPSFEKYEGKTASEVDFAEFLSQLTFADEPLLLSFSARRFEESDEVGEPMSLNIYSSAWRDRTEAWSNNMFVPEVEVTLNIALNIADRLGVRKARVEAQYELTYYTFVPIDDHAFSKLAQSKRFLQDMWPTFSGLVERLMEQLEFYDFSMEGHSVVGPREFQVS